MQRERIVKVRKIISSLMVVFLLGLPVHAAQIDIDTEYFKGKVGINKMSPAAALDVIGSANSTAISSFRGLDNQDLTQWYDASGALKASVDKDGKLFASGFRLGTTTTAGYILQAAADGTATWVNPSTITTTIPDLTNLSGNISTSGRITSTYVGTGYAIAAMSADVYAGRNVGIGTGAAALGARLDILSSRAESVINIKASNTSGSASPFTVRDNANTQLTRLNPYASSDNYLFDTASPGSSAVIFEIKNAGVSRLSVDNTKTTIIGQLDVGSSGAGTLNTGNVNNIIITKPSTGTATLTLGTGSSLSVLASKAITLTSTNASATLNIGAGGDLGSNAFNSTPYAPLADPSFSGIVSIPLSFKLGNVTVSATAAQLNKLAETPNGSGSLVYGTAPAISDPTISNLSVSKITIPTTGVGKVLKSTGTGLEWGDDLQGNLTTTTGLTLGDAATNSGKITLADPLVLSQNPAASTVNITANTGIATLANSIVRIKGCGPVATDPTCATPIAVVASAATPIAAGVDGQVLIIVGKGGSVTFTRVAAGGANVPLLLATQQVTIGDGSTLTLIYDGNRWVETNRSLNQ